MFDFLWKKKDPIREPKIGEKWGFKDKDDPFPPEEFQVTIVDVLDGWVKYRYYSHDNTHTKEIKYFILSYVCESDYNA